MSRVKIEGTVQDGPHEAGLGEVAFSAVAAVAVFTGHSRAGPSQGCFLLAMTRALAAWSRNLQGSSLTRPDRAYRNSRLAPHSVSLGPCPSHACSWRRSLVPCFPSHTGGCSCQVACDSARLPGKAISKLTAGSWRSSPSFIHGSARSQFRLCR